MSKPAVTVQFPAPLPAEIECPICSDTKMVCRKTKCNHKFCDECLQEWLKESKKCPTCMVDLE